MRQIADTADRERAVVMGRVNTMTLPTADTVPALQVELTDRTGSLELVFTGRKAIPGIECGVTLRVEGRISVDGRRRVMHNPAYEIVPGREH